MSDCAAAAHQGLPQRRHWRLQRRRPCPVPRFRRRKYPGGKAREGTRRCHGSFTNRLVLGGRANHPISSCPLRLTGHQRLIFCLRWNGERHIWERHRAEDRIHAAAHGAVEFAPSHQLADLDAVPGRLFDQQLAFRGEKSLPVACVFQPCIRQRRFTPAVCLEHHRGACHVELHCLRRTPEPTCQQRRREHFSLFHHHSSSR